MNSNILTIGSDETLVQSRADILSRNYSVSKAKPVAALERLRSQHFDLLLVCHSTPFEDANFLVKKAHQEFPHLCIVRLLTPDSPPIPLPTAHKLITVDFHPEVWLRAVDELLTPGYPAQFY
jgi:hypothetical protein